MVQPRAREKRIDQILKALEEHFPAPRLELDFKNPLECLVATILAAQCTDVMVNQVTLRLFHRYRTARDYAEAHPLEIEDLIRPTGFYRNKARSLMGVGRALVERHGGKVPDNLDDLVALPGVGRKTVNVVLAAAFHRQAIAVDTHVSRVSQRLGLTLEEEPDRIEEDLSRLIPEELWTPATLRLILFGRRVCVARKPRCPACPLNPLCLWERKTPAAPARRRKKAARP